MAMFAHEYNSAVFYHSNDPPLDERLVIKLPLDAAQTRDAHLYFEVAHCSSSFVGNTNETSCFAQGYLPVTNSEGAILFDSQHSIVFYELDKNGERDISLLADMVAGRWDENSKVNRLKTTESLLASTQLRSSYMSQDGDIQV
jgi:hypothetical protein